MFDVIQQNEYPTDGVTQCLFLTSLEAPAIPLDTSPPDWEAGAARLATRWGRAGAVVTVHGELDAANTDGFGDYIQQCAASCEWLVLDVSTLEFIGIRAFATLHTINARCAGADVNWALVPGAAASRLLHICDADNRLPLAESVPLALVAVQRKQLLQPVTYVC